MDRIQRAIVATIVLAFLMAAISGGGALAPAAAKSTDEWQAVTYRVIEDRQNALGEHPILLENPKAHNPSYGELMGFLATDDTVKHKYDKPNFTCADFAEELQNNAEATGINCGYASLRFLGKDSGHAVNVFNTVDEGPVYVDTTSGRVIVSRGLEPGDQYYDLGVICDVKGYW